MVRALPMRPRSCRYQGGREVPEDLLRWPQGSGHTGFHPRSDPEGSVILDLLSPRVLRYRCPLPVRPTPSSVPEDLRRVLARLPEWLSEREELQASAQSLPV